MIVEDEKLVSSLLEKILKNEGHTTICYFDVNSAIEAIKNGAQYDLALLDYHLPGGKGDDVALFSKELNPNSYTIIMTGDENVILSREKILYDNSLKKPFKRLELIDMINNYLK